MKKIVVIGGGFGGLSAVRALKRHKCKITLIDKTNHHLFQPLLYQVATAALSPADIAAPIRSIVRNQKNVKVLLSEVTNIDLKKKEIICNNDKIEYDYLVVAVGSRHSYFGNEKWESIAPGLKTMADALNIRERILTSFETAETIDDSAQIKKYLTFVVVGGGPTGVELSGAIAEISKKTMLKDFRRINPKLTKIILIEAQDRVLSTYSRNLSEKTKKYLEDLGVNVSVNTKVVDLLPGGVQTDKEFIESENIIWAAGNTVPSLIKSLDVEKTKSGKIIVEKDCSLKDFSNVFVIGDAAQFYEQDEPLPAIAPVAIQQGKYVASLIKHNVDRPNRKSFKYFDKGNLATIGKAKAVMQIGKIEISGLTAWVAWVFIHILYLIGFRNRYKVLTEWIWLYISNRNGVRLIIDRPELK